MALFEDLLGGWGGLAVGVAVGVMASPAVSGATGSTLRPLAKSLIRGALAVGDGMREVIAEAREQASDLVAEVQAERANGGSHGAPGHA